MAETSKKGALVKKLTVRHIMGAKVGTLQAVRDLIAKGGDTEIPICRVLGRTSKAKPGATDKGEFVAFVGEFIGINLLSGERFNSGGLILPGAAESAVYGAMGALNDRGQAEADVEFALEIGVKYDASAATQYVYTIRSLVEATASNPMQKLLERAGVDKPALPAPEATGQDTPAGGGKGGSKKK